MSSLIPKLALGSLLILTLSLRAHDGVSQSWDEKAEAAKTQAAAFITQHGFELDHSSMSQHANTVFSRSGGCQLRITVAAPQGWNRYILRRIASDGDHFFFLFRGRKYQELPIWQTRLSTYWTTLVRNRAEPVFGVLGSPSCDMDEIPWQDLA